MEWKKIASGTAASFLLLHLSTAAVILWACRSIFGIFRLNPVHYTIRLSGFEWTPELTVPLILLSGLVPWLAVRRFDAEKFSELSRAAGTAVLLLFPVFFPDSFLLLSLALIVLVWTVVRTGAVCGVRIPEINDRTAWSVVIFAAAAGAVYGIWMQYDSWYRLILGCSDWSVYAEFYRDLYGKGILSYLSTGGHFNLLPNLLFMPLFGMMRLAPDKLFIINSLFIYSTIPAAFFVMRRHGVKNSPAMLFAVSLLFHFTLANLNMTLIYGYHPSVMFPLLFLLFDGAAAGKNYRTAGVFIVLTLLVQETFAVFWFGYGFMMLISGRKKSRAAGVVMMAVMVIYFIAVTKIFMSFAPDRTDGYQQMFHYAHLGNTPFEVLLSPVLRPGAFWGDLLTENNFTFMFLLAAAFLPAIVWRPRRLAAAIPVIAGVWLLKGDTLNNVVMQYQTELFALLIAVSAGGLAARQAGGCSRIGDIISAGMKKREISDAAVLYAVVAGCVICGAFAGRLPWGHFSYGKVMELSVRRDGAIKKLYELIPPGAAVQSTGGFLAHFISRNRLIDFSKGISTEADYIIIPAMDVISTYEDRERWLTETMKIPGIRMAVIDDTPGDEIWCFCIPRRENNPRSLEKSAI